MGSPATVRRPVQTGQPPFYAARLAEVRQPAGAAPGRPLRGGGGDGYRLGRRGV